MMRSDLATTGNLRVKCVVSLLTLYHRSNEISVETVGLVKPKLKTSRHLPPTGYNEHVADHMFKDNHYKYINSASADKFARSRVSSANISRYKLDAQYHFIIIVGTMFVKCGFL